MKNLGQISICGMPFDVVEHSREEDAHLEDCYGYCQYQSFRIVMLEGLPSEAFRNTLLHECCHAIWEHSGLKTLAKMHVDANYLDDFEEMFMQVFMPHLIQALASMKKLKN